VLWGECLSGALYVEDFKRVAQAAGFIDPRQLSISPIAVTDPELKEVTGEAKFFSITYRYVSCVGHLLFCAWKKLHFYKPAAMLGSTCLLLCW
jgi:hypothetical protein